MKIIPKPKPIGNCEICGKELYKYNTQEQDCKWDRNQRSDCPLLNPNWAKTAK